MYVCFGLMWHFQMGLVSLKTIHIMLKVWGRGVYVCFKQTLKKWQSLPESQVRVKQLKQMHLASVDHETGNQFSIMKTHSDGECMLLQEQALTQPFWKPY